jgi:hypothetical protein
VTRSPRGLRYRDQTGEDWADIIDYLTMWPDARRQAVRLLEEIEAPQLRRAVPRSTVSQVDDWTPWEKVGLWVIFVALGVLIVWLTFAFWDGSSNTAVLLRP